MSHPAIGQPTLLAYLDRKLLAVIILTVKNDLITKIHVTADPIAISSPTAHSRTTS